MNVVFAKMMVQSPLSGFCTNLLYIEYVLNHISLNGFWRGYTKKRMQRIFYDSFNIQCYVWIATGTSRIQSLLGMDSLDILQERVVKRQLGLSITYKIWGSFLEFIFAFPRATSLVLQRDISLLFQDKFCLMSYIFSCCSLEQYVIREQLTPQSSTSDV